MSVSLIYLPTGPDGSKVGVDDYLAAGHDIEDLKALATAEIKVPAYEDTTPTGPYDNLGGVLNQIVTTDQGFQRISLTNFNAQIVDDIVVDDGVDTNRFFGIEADGPGGHVSFTVPAREFRHLGWIPENMGPQAVVFPRPWFKEHALTAIQELSNSIRRVYRYAHTGWRKTEFALVYLHAGGAIGADGSLPGIEVSLPDALGSFRLPDPLSGKALIDAINSSLRILDLCPDTVTVPIFAALWRAVLGLIDFSLHITGRTAQGKTELAALAQQHFGPDMSARNLPANWDSTANALQGLAFAAKDALLTIDDLVTDSGQPAAGQRIHREAQRLFRSQGNSSGRQRMRPDATLRPTKSPRGLILSTGEETPAGQSLWARLLVIDLAQDSMNWELLTVCQKEAADGVFAALMASFLQWVASKYETLTGNLKSEIARVRQEIEGQGHHRRIPDVVASLIVGMCYFLDFAQEVGALSGWEVKALQERTRVAMSQVLQAQLDHQVTQDPALRFLQLLGSCLSSGRAHVTKTSGTPPEKPETWGWTRGYGLLSDDYRPQGSRVGWTDGSDLFLDSNSAFAAAQSLARRQGEALPITVETLRRRLDDRGLLASTDSRGGKKRLEVRKTIEGRRRAVLHLRVDSLFDEGVAQVAQSAQMRDPGIESAPGSGTLSRATNPPTVENVAQVSGPDTAMGQRKTPPSGPLGPLSRCNDNLRSDEGDVGEDAQPGEGEMTTWTR